ncbi:MAG: PQQ-binding-like beta-propeller repeat protein [bacterium]|nr:PQQ-binding-like beta-propeller repeat protein [bacterium]
MTKTKFGLAVGGLIIPLFLGQNTLAYNQEHTHPALTDEAVDFYNLHFPQSKITEEEKQALIMGAVGEDVGDRPINHFYDPVHNEGWFGFRSSKVWAQSSAAQQYRNNLYATSGILAGRLCDNDPVDFSYERALLDYAKGNRQRAFEAFGHVMHLLEDANVPEHTRNDTHLSINHSTGSPYETEMAKWNPMNFNVAADLYKKDQKPIQFNILGEYFDSIATYSNNYFFSQDTIYSDKYPRPEVVEIDRIYLGNNRWVFIGLGKNKNGAKLELVSFGGQKVTRNFIEAQDATLINEGIGSRILDGYWERLSKDFVLHGAGAIKMFLDQGEEMKRQYQAELALKQKQSGGNFFQRLFGKIFSGSQESGIAFVQKTLAQIESSSTHQAEDTLEDSEKEAAIALFTPTPAPTILPVASPLVETFSPSPIPTFSATPTPLATTTPTPPLYFSGSGSSIVTPSPTLTPTFTPTPTPIISTPTPTPSEEPTPTPTSTPSPFPAVVTTPTPDLSQRKVVINEIAWMGTESSANDEWIELYNATSGSLDLTDWSLHSLSKISSGSLSDPKIALKGTIRPFGFFLLERTNDQTVSDIVSDQIYTGALANDGEVLELTDNIGQRQDLVSKSLDGWYAGRNENVGGWQRFSMERIDPAKSGADVSSWGTNNGVKKNGLDEDSHVINGTPGALNSLRLRSKPEAITDLTLVSSDVNLLELSWTAPLWNGINLFYDVRYATRSFDTLEDWDKARQVKEVYPVDNFGLKISLAFTVLDFGQEYFFALKVKDDDGQYSNLSNVISYSIPSANSTESWSMAGANSWHTLKLPFPGPFRSDILEEWIFDGATGGAPSQPVIAPNGVVYFGVAHSTAPYLYAIGADGAMLWRNDAVSGAPTTPVALYDNSVVFGHFDFGTEIVALDASGAVRWRTGVGDRVDQITADKHGTVYFSSENNKLTAMKADGTVKWQASNSDIFNVAPVVLDDGNVYTTGVNGGVPTFYAFSGDDGALLWSARLTNNCLCGVSNISYDAEGDTLYATANQYVIKVSRSGTGLQAFLSDGTTFSASTSTVASIGDDNIIVGVDLSRANPASASLVLAINKNTQEIVWKYPVAGVINKQISIDSEENVYFSTKDGRVYSLNSVGKLNWFMEFPYSIFTSPVIVRDALYIALANGWLVRIVNPISLE